MHPLEPTTQDSVPLTISFEGRRVTEKPVAKEERSMSSSKRRVTGSVSRVGVEDEIGVRCSRRGEIKNENE